MRKDQNNAVPMMESIKTLNDYGLEVTSGIILGLDTDSDDTEARLKDFIDVSHIPMLTINLLQALPKTPLWDRLKAAGRLVDDPTLESNVRFLRPYDEVVAMWRRCIAYANDPERLFARFHHQVDSTYVNRMIPPAQGKLNWANLSGALVLAFRVCCTSACCRITASRSGARRATRCGAGRSTPCSAWASSRITSSSSRARRCAASRTRRTTRPRCARPSPRPNWRPRCANRLSRE